MGVAADVVPRAAPGCWKRVVRCRDRRARRLGSQSVRPRGNELTDVPGRDLIERRILGAGQIARVIGPVGRSHLGGHRQRSHGQQSKSIGECMNRAVYQAWMAGGFRRAARILRLAAYRKPALEHELQRRAESRAGSHWWPRCRSRRPRRKRSAVQTPSRRFPISGSRLAELRMVKQVEELRAELEVLRSVILVVFR